MVLYNYFMNLFNEINNKLENRRKYLLIILNITLLIFVVLEISILNTIAPKAEIKSFTKNCVMENRC